MVNAASDSSERSYEEEERRHAPATTLRRESVRQLVEEYYDLVEKNDELCDHLQSGLRNLLDETYLFAEDKWGTSDPFKLQKGKVSDRRKGKLPGDGKKGKKRKK